MKNNKNIKKYIFLFLIIFIGYSILKKDKIYYIPFNIPGSQMAATIPPIGIFIEEKYKNDKSILSHEKIHWEHQYGNMGLFKFYKQYFYEYIKYGRKYGPMEIEARKLSNLKK